MAKIGIDFGTSYSVASYIDSQTGEAKPIRINGLEKIPTMLYFSSDSSTPLVGQVAYEKYDVCKDAESPEEMDDILSGIVTNIKRNMSKEGSIALPNGDILSYAQVVALFLAYIKKEAEKHALVDRQWMRSALPTLLHLTRHQTRKTSCEKLPL